MKNSRLLPIVLVVFIDVLGFAIVIPLLPFYAEHYGASPAAVGGVFSIYAVGSLIGAPLLGRWSDRYGRRTVLLISQCGTFVGFVILALAPSLLWVFVGRALDGLTAANIVTARAYISDVTPPAERTRAFGLVSAAFGFGFMVGPGAAGILAHHGLQWPLWLAAGLSAISIIGTATMMPRGRPTQPEAATAPTVGVLRSARDFFADPELGSRLWQMFGFLFSFSMFTSGFALFCERRLTWHGAPFATAQVGWVLAIVGTISLVMQLAVLQRLVSRYGEARLVAGSGVLGVAAYLLLGGAYGLVILLAGVSLVAVANSVLRPSLLGLISMRAPRARQGAVFGVVQVLQAAASIVGPLIADGLIQIGWLYGWAVACALPLVALLWQVNRRRVCAG